MFAVGTVLACGGPTATPRQTSSPPPEPLAASNPTPEPTPDQRFIGRLSVGTLVQGMQNSGLGLSCGSPYELATDRGSRNTLKCGGAPLGGPFPAMTVSVLFQEADQIEGVTVIIQGARLPGYTPQRADKSAADLLVQAVLLLPYEGAQPSMAKIWIDPNVSAPGQEHTRTFGSAVFTMARATNGQAHILGLQSLGLASSR